MIVCFGWQTLESIYLMWKTTGNPVWRERGWEIFLALEREAKTPSGYASLHGVEKSPAPQMDEQPRCVPAFDLPSRDRVD